MMSLLFLLTASIALSAEPATSPIPVPSCRPCPAGTQEVALMIADAKTYDNLIYGGQAVTWFAPPKGLKQEIYRADSLGEVAAIMAEVAMGCPRIKYLAFFSHGGLGSAVFGKDDLDVTNFAAELAGSECMMADDARVDFAGCNVARGCRGESFLMEVAATLLARGGGSVKGYNNYSTGIFGISIGSIDFKDQVLYVKPGLKSLGWKHSPRSAASCREKGQEIITDAAWIKARVEGCAAAADDVRSLDTVIGVLKHSIEASQKSGWSTWASPLKQSREAGNLFYRSVDVYYWLKDKLKAVGPCLVNPYVEKPSPTGVGTSGKVY